MSRHLILSLMAALLFLSAPTKLYAAQDPIYTGYFSTVAIDGYDPVAYFKQRKAVEGSSKITLEWMGAQWQFSSQENLNDFKNDPEAFAPQYGGYCSWAVAHGDTASTDPNSWQIIDDKLYLNYSPDIHRRWQRKTTEYINSGDKNWPAVLD